MSTKKSSSKKKAKKLDRGLRDFALRLYDLGFNVIPVGRDKRPLCSWSSSKRIDREQLEQLLEKASGIAIVGGEHNPWRPVATLVIIDIDDPSTLECYPRLRELVETTVRWHTGPRCPHCNEKHLEVLELGKRFKCRKCNVELSVEECKRGIASLVTVEPEAARKYLHGTVRGKDVELLINNYALIPPSRHPSGVRYEWIRPFDFEAPNLGVRALVESELAALLEELGIRSAAVTPPTTSTTGVVREQAAAQARVGGQARLRRLSQGEVVRVVELLKPFYQPGHRQNLCLYLSGHMAYAGIHPISVAEVIRMLHAETQDNDKIETRLSVVLYTYKKLASHGEPVWDEQVEREFVNWLKENGLERVYGMGYQPAGEVEFPKGRSGLFEVLVNVLGQSQEAEERVNDVINQLNEILRHGRSDIVCELIDYDKRIYYCAHLSRRFIARMKREEGRLVIREKIYAAVPIRVTVYLSPFSGERRVEIEWAGDERVLPKPMFTGPASVPDIASLMRSRGFVYHSRLAEDALAAVVNAFLRRGIAEVKAESDAPGFYWVDGRVVANRVEVGEPPIDELKEALELLNELAEVWYGHVKDKFATIVKWFMVSPFNFCIKQKSGRWMPWLYLFGPTGTGKSTLGKMGLALCGLDPDSPGHFKGGSQVDTPARLGNILSRSTFPVVVNEPGGVFEKPELVEMIKAAVEGLVARGTITRGVYEEIPSLSPLVFTSNRVLPEDDALLRRMVVIHFTFSDVIPHDREREFEERVKPRLQKLRSVGRYAQSRVLLDPSLLDKEWVELGEQLLEEMYAKVGVQPPSWVKLRAKPAKTREELYEEIREMIRGFFIKRINEEFARFVGRYSVVEHVESEYGEGVRWETVRRDEVSFDKRLQIVVEARIIPWLVKVGDEVLITTGILSELRNNLKLDLTMKSLAELMGIGRYNPKRSLKIGGKTTSVSCVETTYQELLDFLQPSEPLVTCIFFRLVSQVQEHGV